MESTHWTDQGEVIQSGSSMTYNAIDPSVTFDSSSNLWMSFSYLFSGIKLIQLDATTRPSEYDQYDGCFNCQRRRRQWRPDPKASYLCRRKDVYLYLVDWGTCCATPALTSTYNVHIGRSTNITGPFRDSSNVEHDYSGGTLFLKATGRFIAPGPMGILDEDGVSYFRLSYLDANDNGVPTYDLEPLSWTRDGWPVFTNDWKAAYQFQMDAAGR